MLLKNLISSDQKTAKLPFPMPGGQDPISFELAFLPRGQFTVLSKSCESAEFDQKLKRPVASVDNEKLLAAVVRKSVKGISGLTYRKLLSLVPVDEESLNSQVSALPLGLDTEIPFSPGVPEQVDFITQVIKTSYSIESWLLDAVMDIANFQSVTSEEVSKNSASLPSSN